MKKFFIVITALTIVTTAFAQKKDTTIVKAPVAQEKKKDWSKIDLSHRANDHFMLQIGYDNLAAVPDTLSITGFSRSFNFYFMYDFPFKSDPRFSVGAGLGIGSSNLFFSNQPASPISVVPRADASGGAHFKKYKVVTTFLEIPLELRFALDPENTNKSWKFAIGTKVGAMLSAYAKGKNVENGSGQIVDGSVYKISSKSYYNTIKLAGTARISKGPFGVFAQYQVTSLIKGIDGPAMYPFSFGICISGL
jgi:hypothetical protein